MNLKQLLNPNSMGLITSLLSGKKVEPEKIFKTISTFITDESVKEVAFKIHQVYKQESDKLGVGHSIKIVVEPDEKRGLKLAFWDYVAATNSLMNELYIAELTAIQVNVFIAQLFGVEYTPNSEADTGNEIGERINN